jgi:hypothetical protein
MENYMRCATYNHLQIIGRQATYLPFRFFLACLSISDSNPCSADPSEPFGAFQIIGGHVTLLPLLIY